MATAPGIPQVSMPIRTSCPVCGCENTRIAIDGEDRELSIPNMGSSRTELSHGRILRCDQCTFGFRQVRPEDHQLAVLYRDANDAVYEREMAGRWKTARDYSRLVRKYLPKPGAILDVGCASGAFLRTMADAGWRAYGVEPSQSQFARAERNLDGRGTLYQCTLQEAQLPESCDAVTMWDVLEHVTDPIDFLQRCRDLVKPGGYLFVKTPDLSSRQAQWMGERWPLLLAEHLNYFNSKSMQTCANSVPLSPVWMGRSCVHFSPEYVLFRLSQHSIPGTHLAGKLLSLTGLHKLAIPIWMGELLSIWRRP